MKGGFDCRMCEWMRLGGGGGGYCKWVLGGLDPWDHPTTNGSYKSVFQVLFFIAFLGLLLLVLFVCLLID